MRVSTLTLTLLLVVSMATPALAADNKDAGKEQLRRMQLAQRKLEQEKSQLTQEKTRLETELKESQAKAGAADQKLSETARRSSSLSRELQGLREEKEKLTTTLADVRQQVEKQKKELDVRTANEARLSANLKQRDGDLKLCESKNLALYEYGEELAQRLAKWSFVDTLAAVEPFTGIKRARMEGLIDEYRDKLEAQKLEPKPEPVKADEKGAAAR